LSDQNNGSSDLKLWICFSIIGIAMLCLWVYGYLNIYAMFISRQWPSVTRKIIQSKVDKSPGSYRASSPSKKALIVYRYQINNAYFSSDRVLWGSQTYHFGFNEPDRLVNKYPVGKSVTVYYDPKKPSEAVLERRARILDYGFVGFCSFVLFLQIYFLVHLWRKKQPGSSKILIVFVAFN
jgi:hypothetical protein